MSEEQDFEMIELSMDEAKAKIALARDLEKLQNNEYFKRVFMDKYLNSYAVRLVKLKASHGMQSEAQQTNIMNQIQGIGQMHQYMLYIDQEGRIAEKALEDYEAEREEMLREIPAAGRA